MSFLGQWLRQMTAKDVRGIAAKLFPGEVTSWGRASEIAARIEENLLDEEYLTDFISRLSDREMGVVSLFVWGIGSQGIQKVSLEALLARVIPVKPMESLAFLIDRGIIFKTYGGWSDQLAMPEDLAYRLSLILTRRAMPRSVPADDNVTENIFSGNFYEDCLTFIAYIHKNQVVLTQKGLIRKKIFSKIAALMQLQDDPADISPRMEYPLRFYLLLEYCISSNLVHFLEQSVIVDVDNVKQWLKQKTKDMVLKGASFIWNESLEVCPNPHVQALMNLVTQMKENYWYGFSDLAGAARKLFAPFTTPGPTPEAFLEIILGAGLLVEGISPDSTRLVRLGFWSPRKTLGVLPELPLKEDGFWVQPNFEILVPPQTKPELRWQLEMVADPVKVDQTFTYALSRESALAFFDRGGKAQDMLTFLEGHSKNPLPQNVLFTIREWDALYGRISFWDVFLLKCDTVELAEEITANSKLKTFIHGRFDQTHLVISRKQYDSLLEALQKQGYFPKKGIIRQGN